MSFPPGNSSGGIGPGYGTPNIYGQGTSGGGLAQQQQMIQQQQTMQQQYKLQYQQQYQQQYYQSQTFLEQQRQFEEVFDALCKFLLYENGIPKEKHEKYIKRCAAFLLKEMQANGSMSEIRILQLLKTYVPTIKFDSEMSDLLGDEE